MQSVSYAEALIEEHKLMLKEAEESGMVILATKSEHCLDYVFQSPNEV